MSESQNVEASDEGEFEEPSEVKEKTPPKKTTQLGVCENMSFRGFFTQGMYHFAMCVEAVN